MAMGNYRQSPFITGSNWPDEDKLKTEIFNYEADEWAQADNYPFSNGDR